MEYAYVALPLFLLAAYGAGVLALLAHEFAHAAVAAIFRLPYSHITIGTGPTLFSSKRLVWKLLPLGGEFVPTGEMTVSMAQVALVAIAGPLANLLIALCAATITLHCDSHGVTRATSFVATTFNLAMFFDNARTREGTDGMAFWNFVSHCCTGKDMTLPVRAAFNAGGVFAQVATTGAFVWVVWMTGQ